MDYYYMRWWNKDTVIELNRETIQNGVVWHWVWLKINWSIFVVLVIILSIILYFMRLFGNYCRLLMGNDSLSLWKMPYWVYIYILVLFAISYYLWVPRIYIVWLLIFIFNIYYVIKLLIFDIQHDYYVGCEYKMELRWDWRMIALHIKYMLLTENDRMYVLDHWKGIYDNQYFADYWIFCTYDYFPRFEENYNIFEVFIYSPERRLKMALLYFASWSFEFVSGANYPKLLSFLEACELKISAEEFYKMVWPNETLSAYPGNGLYKLVAAKSEYLSVYEYLSLEEGSYY